jgi:class 3 adenylate cyclase/Tfp pilus assembly protein PilF
LSKDSPDSLQKHLDRLSRAISPTADSSSDLKGGEVRDVAVLFLDIVGYTELAEKLKDPERIYHVITTVFRAFSDIIRRHNGRVEKYIGDAIMAVWGTGQASEYDAERAIAAAQEIFEDLKSINQILESINLKLAARIGINAGPVIFDPNRIPELEPVTPGQWMVIGDVVNTAARIESTADSGEIRVSAAIRERAGEAFEYADRGLITVKGKEIQIHVFTVTGKGPGRKDPWKRAALVKKSPMVGREKELECLIRLFNTDAIPGLHDLPKHRLICLKGEAGIGKSRLCREFLERVKASVLQARALPYAGRPFASWYSILHSHFGLSEDDPKGNEKLDRGIKSLLRKLPNSQRAHEIKKELLEHKSYLSLLLGLDSQDRNIEKLDDEVKNLETQLALRYFLEAIAACGRTIVVFEDFHWIDNASLECLEFVLRTVRAETPILFLCLFRPETRLTEFSLGNAILDEISIGPVTDEDCRSLLRYMFEGGLPMDAEQFILARVHGNPFFLEELLLSFAQKGIVRRHDGEWQLAFPLTEAETPRSLSTVILSRFDDLDEACKTVLRRASVIGTEFPMRVYGKMTEKLGGTVDSERMMQTLESRDFIYSIRKTPETTYAFKHALTQSVIYDSLLHYNRKILHRKAAESYEDLAQAKTDGLSGVIAHHWDKANDRAKAIDWGEKALNYSDANYQITDGLKWSHKLDDWLTQEPGSNQPNSKLISNLKKMVRLQRSSGMHGDWKNTLNRLSGLMSDESSASARVWLSDNYGLYNTLSGNKQEALKHYQDAWEIAEVEGNSAEKRNILTHFGMLYINMGRPQQAIDYFNRALEIDAGEPIDPRQHGSILSKLGVAQVGIEDTAAALQNYQIALELHRSCSERLSEAVILGNIARIHHRQGNLTEAESCYCGALKIHRETGSFMNEGRILLCLGDIKLESGDITQSLALYKEAEKVAGHIQNQRLNGFVAESMGKWYKLQNQNEQALQYFEKALRFFQEIAYPLNAADQLVKMGLLNLEAGSLDSSLDCYQQIIRHLENTSINPEENPDFVMLRSKLIEKGVLDSPALV